MSVLYVMACLALICSVAGCIFGLIALLAAYALRRELNRIGLLAVVVGATGIPLGILNVMRFAP